MSGLFLLGAVVLVLGVAFYGLFVSGRRADDSEAAGDNWQSGGTGSND